MVSHFLRTDPTEIALDIADRVRTLRLLRGWTQAELARRTGIALPTLKLFEQTGNIAVDRLLRIAAVLGTLEEFPKLFGSPPATTLDEIEARAAAPRRKYGRRARANGPPNDATNARLQVRRPGTKSVDQDA